MFKALTQSRAVVATGQKLRNSVKMYTPPVPEGMDKIFSGFHIPYQYNDGIRTPYFVKMVFWREPGPFCGRWVGMYQIELIAGRESWVEKYFWAFDKGMFHEVTQRGLRGLRQRLLRA